MGLVDTFNSLNVKNTVETTTEEIIAQSPFDVSQRGAVNDTLARFKGVDRQLIINTEDNYRPVIMDGQTLGGKTKVAILNGTNHFDQVPTTESLSDEELNSADSDNRILCKKDVLKVANIEAQPAKVINTLEEATEINTIYFIKE